MMIRMAVETRVLNTTNSKPLRLVANVGKTRVVKSWDHGKNDADNHRDIAMLALERQGVDMEGKSLVAGHIRKGMAWVIVG